MSMFQDIQGASYGKLPNPDGNVAPHLNYGLNDVIDTKPKPNVNFQRLRALFDSRDYVYMHEAKRYDDRDSVINSIARNRGFRFEFDQKTGRVSAFTKQLSKPAKIKPMVNVAKPVTPVKRKEYATGCYKVMLADIEKNKRIVKKDYVKTYCDTAIKKSIKKVKAYLAKQGLELEEVRMATRGRPIFSWQLVEK